MVVVIRGWGVYTAKVLGGYEVKFMKLVSSPQLLLVHIHALTVRCWTRCLISLNLSVSFCKVRMAYSRQVYTED